MPQVDPDRLPTSDDRRGRCPRCGHLSNFSEAKKQAIVLGPPMAVSGHQPVLVVAAVIAWARRCSNSILVDMLRR
jgi:hypothetical protein